MPKAFVVAEEEQPILFDGSAHSASKLVPPERRNRHRIKKIPRVQRAVTEKLEKRPVKLIRSGLRHDCDLRSGSLAIFSGVSSGQHIEFSDCIDPQ